MRKLFTEKKKYIFCEFKWTSFTLFFHFFFFLCFLTNFSSLSQVISLMNRINQKLSCDNTDNIINRKREEHQTWLPIYISIFYNIGHKCNNHIINLSINSIVLLKNVNVHWHYNSSQLYKIRWILLYLKNLWLIKFINSFYYTILNPSNKLDN